MSFGLQQNRSSRSTRQGLTLVELLTALVLSAMIMAILLVLVGKLSLARDLVKKEKPFEPWKTILKQQLQRDYVGCRSVLVNSREIKMDGYAELVDREGVRRDGPCSIRYYIVTKGDSDLMFREQRDLLVRDNTSKELVCRTVSGFKSSDELSTDVAPGILHLEMRVVPNSTANQPAGDSGNDPAGKPAGGDDSISVVLLRHGAPE